MTFTLELPFALKLSFAPEVPFALELPFGSGFSFDLKITFSGALEDLGQGALAPLSDLDTVKAGDGDALMAHEGVGFVFTFVFAFAFTAMFCSGLCVFGGAGGLRVPSRATDGPLASARATGFVGLDLVEVGCGAVSVPLTRREKTFAAAAAAAADLERDALPSLVGLDAVKLSEGLVLMEEREGSELAIAFVLAALLNFDVLCCGGAGALRVSFK